MSVLLNFSLQCFHILAWPLLAFGYPLFASIQAIEANSDSSTRKLITYWVCLSLLLLLDHAFYWLPYWPFMKLMIVGCLSIPCFEGSFYIYNHLVRPILSVNPCDVFTRFIKMFEIILKEDDNPPTKIKKEVTETEPQAMEDLIASMGMVERPKVEPKDKISKEIKPLEQPLETNLLVADSAQITSETQDSKISETLWPCVLCKVKCRRKLDLILHFQGQRHAKALESLKARPNSQYYFKPWTCQICNAQLKNKNNLISHFDSKRHLTACEMQKLQTKTSVVLDEVSSVSFEKTSTLTSKEQKEEPINPKTGSYLEILMQPTSE